MLSVLYIRYIPCVYIYIYICVYIYRDRGQALPQTDKHCAPHFFNSVFPITIIYIYDIYHMTGSLLWGTDPGWHDRHSTLVLQYCLSVHILQYVLTYLGFSSTHTHSIPVIYTTLYLPVHLIDPVSFFTLSHFISWQIFKKSGNFVLSWPYFT